MAIGGCALTAGVTPAVVTVTITPESASVFLGATLTFQANVTGTSNAAVVWEVNGQAEGNASVGTISAGGAYTAPAVLPSPATVVVTAVSEASPGASGSANVTLHDDIVVGISPASASVATGGAQGFTATVTGAGAASTAVTWSVNGAPDGNAIVGQICVTGSNPCAAPGGAIVGSLDYLAPATVPATNPVTLTATSVADGTKSGNAAVTIAGPPPSVGVTISPGYAFVAPSGATLTTVQFAADVTGTTNMAVTWSVASGVAGQGCGGAACGSVSATGLFTAPGIAPSPNSIAVTATSAADTTKSATAMVSLTSGPTIEVVLPSSVMAGAVEGFPLSVEGVDFTAGSGSGASVILFNGAARSTTCGSTTVCSIALTPSDVESATTVTLQVQNPGPPGALSNVVPFVVVPFDVSRETITLTAAAPSATGLNFVVTEPTTAAEGSAIDVDAIGPLANQNCTLGAAPVMVTRPESGTATVSMCLHGNGLDPSFTYVFTGPGSGDIPVTASAVTGLFPNTIELDMQISKATEPGLRTLVITTINNDQAIATGLLEVD